MIELLKKEVLNIIRDRKRQFSILIYSLIGSIILSLTLIGIERMLVTGIISFLGYFTATTALYSIVNLEKNIQLNRVLLLKGIAPEKIFFARLIVGTLFIFLFRLAQILAIGVLFNLNNLSNTILVTILSSFAVVALGLTIFTLVENFEHGDLVAPIIFGSLLVPSVMAELALYSNFNFNWAIFLFFSVILYSYIGIELIRRGKV